MKTKRTKTGILAILTLTILTGCDYAERNEQRAERENSAYHAAMADFKADRINQAIAGFRKVLRANPGNSSARFQLACIQQDVQSDYTAAYCNFHEYLLQNPDSDKAALAKERFGQCELELARRLADKHGLKAGGASAEELARAEKSLKTSEETRAKLVKDLGEATRKIAALEADRQRLVAAMKTDTEKESDKPSSPLSKRDLKALLEEDEEEDGDRIARSRDVAALRLEEKDENEESSSLLPARTGKALERAAFPLQRKHEEAEPPHEKRPETYVVQEGDTLTRIALRFYGRKSAWLKIRDANKAVITTDGRVRLGDVIRLP